MQKGDSEKSAESYASSASGLKPEECSIWHLAGLEPEEGGEKLQKGASEKSAESNASSASGLKPKPKKETKIAEPKPKKEKKSAESSASSVSGLKPNVEALICWPDSD